MKSLLNYFLPRHCLLCDCASIDANLCPGCAGELPRCDSRCAQCALPLPANHGLICGACLVDPPPWQHALSALDYGYPVPHLVRRFKFQRDLACGAVLQEELSSAVREHSAQLPDAVLPVPLHRWRHVMRCFNQADLLARAVGRATGVPVISDLLQRRRRTQAQSGLDATGRWRNMRGAFRLNPRWSQLPARRLAVVDDVMTTGATMSACCKVLMAAGAREIFVWVAARAPPP